MNEIMKYTVGNTEQREHYVDFIKAIAIVLVILGHINSYNAPIKAWIYSFHMPVFFFATGLVLKNKKIDSKYLLSKVQRLIVPYFIWGLIYSGYSEKNLLKLIYGSYSTISSSGSLSSLWFLPTMFVSLILVQVLLKISNKFVPLVVISVVSFCIGVFLPKMTNGYPFCIDIAFIIIPFILSGYFFNEEMHKNNSFLKRKLDNTAGYCLVTGVGFVLTLLFFKNPICKESYVLLAKGNIGNPLIFFVTAFGGCLMLYGMAKILSKIKLLNKPLSFIGSNTMTVFLVHKPIISVLTSIVQKYGFMQEIGLFFVCVGTLFLSLVICLLINQFAPFLVGKTKK